MTLSWISLAERVEGVDVGGQHPNLPQHLRRRVGGKEEVRGQRAPSSHPGGDVDALVPECGARQPPGFPLVSLDPDAASVRCALSRRAAPTPSMISSGQPAGTSIAPGRWRSSHRGGR
jgi:hypothetical protein